jgi:cytochrome oxidase Cu insertion factor (SCO1/SenC/PrrC family)
MGIEDDSAGTKEEQLTSKMFHTFRAAIAAASIVLTVASTVGSMARQQANTPVTPLDVETVGPQVGDALPDFSLRDQRGQVRSLKSLLGPNGAVIVFFRSADW